MFKQLAVIAALGVSSTCIAEELPIPAASLTVTAGPALHLTQTPCGTAHDCKSTVGSEVELGFFGRIVPGFSLGPVFALHHRGTANDTIGVFPLSSRFGQSVDEYHLDLVGRFHFRPRERIAPLAEVGFGLSAVEAHCANVSGGVCTTGVVPTFDLSPGLSLRAAGGIDWRVLPHLAVELKLVVMAAFSNDGHICGDGACATSPGFVISVAPSAGVSVDIGQQ